MCGRYANTKRPAEIDEHFGVPIRGDIGTRRFNIAPTEEVLAIVAPHGDAEADVLRWGLIPSWAKDTKGTHKMINARIETVTTSPAYRTLISKGSRRALQIADGYFEWLKPEKRGESRQPFFFQVDGGELFAFAARTRSNCVARCPRAGSRRDQPTQRSIAPAPCRRGRSCWWSLRRVTRQPTHPTYNCLRDSNATTPRQCSSRGRVALGHCGGVPWSVRDRGQP